MSSTVRDVMITPVVTVRPDTPFKHVVARVRAVGAVPVTDDSGLVLGMVGERDLLATKGRLEGLPGRLAAARRHGGRGTAAGATAASLMSSPAVMTRAEATTGEAARLMFRHRLGSLPVVDWLGRLVGIISEGDVLDGFTRRDADIHREVVRDVIAREVPARPAGIHGLGPGRRCHAVGAAGELTRSGTCWPRPCGASRGWWNSAIRCGTPLRARFCPLRCPG